MDPISQKGANHQACFTENPSKVIDIKFLEVKIEMKFEL